ncbi:MAG TPA: response regulator transcription factor [Dehalococcoidia bacterium]|nr:response regulator transcription factor [Dehalococcoidia bacterium]
MTESILVVEDDTTLASALRYNLERNGYTCLLAGDGARALELAAREHPSLVVLDLMLPGIDGMEVCRRIRSDSTVPIIMMTARVEEVDRVVGLEVGADDYVTKPFSMRELMARVHAALRRAQMRPDANELRAIEFGGLQIDPARREVRRGGELLALKPKEYELLLFFARNPRRVFSRDQLLERVWGYDFGGGSRTVDVHVHWLREKIEDEPARPVYLRTSRGAGYIFDGATC